jgi:hypothetical protein
MNRRQLIGSIALAGATAAEAQSQSATIDEERRRALQPVLERRKVHLQAVRDFEIDDSVEPFHGCV